MNGVQFDLYLFLGPETQYLGDSVKDRPSILKSQYLSLRRIDPVP